MEIDKIKKNAPPSASHYGIEHDEVVYFYCKPWGYCYCSDDRILDEFDAYLLQIKPL